MIRRLFIVAVSLAALTACTTYNSGYRNYSPAQAGYGDYYYAPDPGPSYYSPGYVNYPAYYSLYWGFDRHYYSSWRQPHFHYGVTWFPNDWFSFSVVNRYPRYNYWHPYAPYRYSAWDHRFGWNHYAPPPRYRYRPAPRYGHPSNERHMQREQFAGGRGSRDSSNYHAGPRARSAMEAAAPQRLGNAPQRAAYRPQSATPAANRGATQESPGPEARMRQQAIMAREARLRDEGLRGARPSAAGPAETRQSVQRPWQQGQPASRGRTAVMQEAAPPRSIPDRRDSQAPRQVMGNARSAPMPQQQRMPVRQGAEVRGAEVRPDVRQAPRRQAPAQLAPRPNAMPPASAPAAPQRRMQQAAPPRAAPAPAPMRQAPVRQAAPARAAPARAAPAPAPMRQSAPAPAPQAAPPSRPATRSTGRARGAIEQEP